MKQEQKKFSAMSDADIWTDLVDAELKAEIVKQSPLFKALRRANEAEPWCCIRARTISYLEFKDGTKMRVHCCPLCGREL